MATNSIVKATRAGLRQDLERIESLTSLPDDWNTYGGVPVTKRAAASASGVLRELATEDQRPNYTSVRPHGITPLASGGLNLEWRGPYGELTIEIYPDERLGCYTVEVRDGDMTERDEENPAMTAISASLRCILGFHQPE